MGIWGKWEGKEGGFETRPYQERLKWVEGEVGSHKDCPYGRTVGRYERGHIIGYNEFICNEK